MFKINLYATIKRENSTKIPDGSGVTKDVVLKDETSLLNPVFVLNYSNSNPTQYNYLYCSQFLRYYFIRDWVFDGRMWEAHCEVDPMASFKQQILSSKCYVLRSASKSNSHVRDTIYPAKTNPTYHFGDKVDIGFTQGMDSRYVIGSITRDTNLISPTGITYYCLDAIDMNNMRNKLFPDLTQALLDKDTLLDVPAIMISNPIQYIQSAMYFPFLPSKTTAKEMWLGYYKVIDYNNTQWSVEICNSLIHIMSALNIHFPMPSLSRGDWVGQEPYTYYNLYVPYFGVVNIPSDVVTQFEAVSVVISVSIVTGQGTLKIYAGMYTGFNAPIITRSSQVGQPAPIAGMSSDFGTMANGIGRMVGGTMSAMTNKPTGLLDIALGGMETAYGSIVGVPESTGFAGGSSEYENLIIPFTKTYEPLEEDNTQFGRPLCEQWQLSALSGFCQVADGLDIQTRATPKEKDIIRRYVEGGFYIE